MRKIEGKLYRFCHGRGVWSYTIIAIEKEQDRTLYRLRANSCVYGTCSGCIVWVDAKKMEAVKLVNSEGDSDIWHERSSNKYHEQEVDALREMYSHNIVKTEEDIERLNKALERDIAMLETLKGEA